MISMIAPRTIRPSGANIDIVKDLGLDHIQRVYERRIHAVAAPTDYNKERKSAWANLTAAVAKAYKDTDENRDLIASSISTVQRQQLAVDAAKMVFTTQSAILESDFPSGSQAIALESSARDNFPGLMNKAPRTRAAPRRKAAPKAQIVVVAAPAAAPAAAKARKPRARKTK